MYGKSSNACWSHETPLTPQRVKVEFRTDASGTLWLVPTFEACSRCYLWTMLTSLEIASVSHEVVTNHHGLSGTVGLEDKVRTKTG